MGSGIKSHGIRDQKPWDQGSKAMGSGITSHGIRDQKSWDQGSKAMGSGITSHGIRDHKPWEQGSKAMGSGIKDQGSGCPFCGIREIPRLESLTSGFGVQSTTILYLTAR